MYLGIDLGTSEVKVIIIDAQQQLICSQREALTVQRPHPLWSEQHPDDWWQATLTALAQLKASHPEALAAVRGIGLSGQMHGAVLLDAANQVLRPAILWNDTRAGEECQELERRVPNQQQITGNLAMPGFTAAKLLWVAKHEPELFNATKKILLPKDYLRFKLSGDFVSDMSDASGTLWLDIAARDWSDIMLTACGLNRSHMPRLVEGSDCSGYLTSELAQLWGMEKKSEQGSVKETGTETNTGTGTASSKGSGIAIAGGAGDNAASAIGMGVIAEGQGLISLGTSGVFFVANDSYRPNPSQGLHTFCHALPGQWHQMGVMLSAASCLRWVTQLTNSPDEATLMEQIRQANGPACPHAPLFLPYLSGERTPHNNPHAKGVWFGLTHDTDPGLLGYSVLEGVAFGLLDSYRALQQAGAHQRKGKNTGEQTDKVVSMASLVGGGSKSIYWAQLLASILTIPLSLHDSANIGAALGAARLGMMAAHSDELTQNPDQYQNRITALCQPPPIQQIVEPNPDWHAALQCRFERYRAIYAALHPLF